MVGRLFCSKTVWIYGKIRPSSDVVLLPCRTKLQLGSAKYGRNITLIQTSCQSRTKCRMYGSHVTNFIVPSRENAVPSKYINIIYEFCLAPQKPDVRITAVLNYNRTGNRFSFKLCLLVAYIKVAQYSFFRTIPNFLNWQLSSLPRIGWMWNLHQIFALDWSLLQCVFEDNRYFHGDDKQETTNLENLEFYANNIWRIKTNTII